MKLYEFEGKQLFKRYGIPIPRGVVVTSGASSVQLTPPYVIKAQVRSGDRMKHGGILFAGSRRTGSKNLKHLLRKTLNGEAVRKVLIEEKISSTAEYYVSFSYDTDSRGPVLGLSMRGGTGIKKAAVAPIDITQGIPAFSARQILRNAHFPSNDLTQLPLIIQNLWRLFISENALLAEINPLFKAIDGRYIAGDAKIILDDAIINPNKRRNIDMQGDIAILASGGGASMLCIDMLLESGGSPANYTEYSGNPPASVVRQLTKKVLQKSGLFGCWVVGGTANFTDIFETMSGFMDGLDATSPKPRYPIVIRRDGPRQKEAFAFVREVARKKKFDIHLFGSETSMAETARVITKLTRKYRRLT